MSNKKLLNLYCKNNIVWYRIVMTTEFDTKEKYKSGGEQCFYK